MDEQRIVQNIAESFYSSRLCHLLALKILTVGPLYEHPHILEALLFKVYNFISVMSFLYVLNVLILPMVMQKNILVTMFFHSIICI